MALSYELHRRGLGALSAAAGAATYIRAILGYVETAIDANSSLDPISRKIPSHYFDSKYYLETYADVAAAGVDPLKHYIQYGWRENRNPNPWLSTKDYIRQHPEIYSRGEDPLSHLTRTTLDLSTHHDVTGQPVFLNKTQNDMAYQLFSSINAYQPLFPNKWLDSGYLAFGMSEIDRVKTCFNTYIFLNSLYSEQTTLELLLSRRCLWSKTTADGNLSIWLSISEPIINEGELSLVLHLDYQAVYILSFSIFPDESEDGTTRNRLLISRMQVASNGQSALKRAAKLMADATPQVALFAAAQGFSQAVGITEFVGVPAARQVSLSPGAVARCQGVYDAFYTTHGGALGEDGFFHGPMIAEERPLALIKAGHKIRTRRKRALRSEIRAAAASAMQPPGSVRSGKSSETAASDRSFAPAMDHLVSNENTSKVEAFA